MTTSEIKNIATSKLSSFSTEELIAILSQNNNNFAEGVQIAFEAILEILEVRMSEVDFAELCETL